MKRIIHEVMDGCERWVVVDDAGVEHEVFRRELTMITAVDEVQAMNGLHPRYVQMPLRGRVEDGHS